MRGRIKTIITYFTYKKRNTEVPNLSDEIGVPFINEDKQIRFWGQDDALDLNLKNKKPGTSE